MIRTIISTGLTGLVAASFALPAVAWADPVQPGVSQPAAPLALTNKLAGKTVFLDPGQQGHLTAAQLAPAPAGAPCQAASAMINGVPDQAVNWKIAQLVKTSLEAVGAKVVLSRPNYASFAGCQADRTAAANASGADVAVTINTTNAAADSQGVRFVVPSLDAKGPTTDAKSLLATQAIRDAYSRVGFKPAADTTTLDGLQTPSLQTPSLQTPSQTPSAAGNLANTLMTKIPLVNILLGNASNVLDSKVMASPAGELQSAIAIATGIAKYLVTGDSTLAATNPGSQNAMDPIAQQSSPVIDPHEAAVPGRPLTAVVPGTQQTLPGTPGLQQTNPGMPGLQSVDPAAPTANLGPRTSRHPLGQAAGSLDLLGTGSDLLGLGSLGSGSLGSGSLDSGSTILLPLMIPMLLPLLASVGLGSANDVMVNSISQLGNTLAGIATGSV